ncbi:polysaccharide pyruvyl transferase family protein [Sphingosinicella sp. CPCC 101087]|uniref:polysaccharide pyruvyl transferase family protein n=1 Tax=Sphingosinicella sp. CPCC 101087 TaxID=2497754 RepID=UPI00101BFCFF|nr:polysaccharide pyruvyl transferase family protein [Sphingosinicella sp. CPCC 101087]
MPRPKKIGVLTFHRCINYGSYWQARCLVEGLKAKGHEAVLLDHDSAQVNRAEWRCALQPLLPARVPSSDFPLYAAKARKLLAAMDAVPRSPRFPLDRPEEAEDHELVIVGSDEVWNLHHPWYGGRSIFYGDGLRSRRLASYAASFGNHDAADGLGRWWADRLRRFESISVRDENSRHMVRSALGHEPAVVLDPCLQFPPAIPDGGPVGPPFVAVYGHSFPAWFAAAVRRWARSRGYRLLSIGYRNDWADDQRIDAAPGDFARLIAQATAVATNFFHGCVFALLTGRPFACASSRYRENKVRDLAHALGLEARLTTERTGSAWFDRILAEPPGLSIRDRIAGLRRQSDRYLDHVLG